MATNFNPMSKKRAAVDVTGPVTNQYLLEHGVDEGVETFVKIHVHEIELNVSGACVITLKLGNKDIFKRELLAKGEYHVNDDDMFTNDAQAGLIIAVDNAVSVTGYIRYSVQ